MMNRVAAVEDRGQRGDPEASTELAEEVVEAGPLLYLPGRQGAQGDRRDGYEHRAQPEAPADLGPEQVVPAAFQGPVAHPDQADQKHADPEPEDGTGPDPPDQAARDGHHERGGDARRQD